MDAGWDELRRELDVWEAQGQRSAFWWRDDDATAPTPALRRLLDLGAGFGIDLALAVVPAAAEDGLAALLDAYPRATVVQHGFAHANHAAAGARAAECGGARLVAQVLDELRRGFERLGGLFGPRFAPILAAPWNRIDAAVIPGLPALGFRGLSLFGPRRTLQAAPGLTAVNAHCDPLAWRNPPRFAGAEKLLALIVDNLADRRRRDADRDEPLGLLTHHLDHDDDAWKFVGRLLAMTTAHPAARWLGAREAFGLDEPLQAPAA